MNPIEPMPIEYLEPNPYQYRTFTEEDLADLVQSIREHGFIGHLEVRPADPDPQDKTRSRGKYQLVDGARRLAAAKLAGLTKLPVRRVWRDDTEMEILCYLTNSTIKPVSYWEEAQYFKRLQEHGWSVRQIARAIAKSPSYIQRRLDVLRNEDPEVLQAASSGKIDLAAAALLPYIPPEKRKEVFAKLSRGELTYTDLRALHRFTPEVRDDGRQVFTIPLPPREETQPPQGEERRFEPETKQTQVLEARVPEPPVEEKQDLTGQPEPPRVIWDSTVFTKKTPADHTRLFLLQLRSVVPSLEERLRKIDLSTLSHDELDELRQLAERLRAVAVQIR